MMVHSHAPLLLLILTSLGFLFIFSVRFIMRIMNLNPLRCKTEIPFVVL